MILSHHGISSIKRAVDTGLYIDGLHYNTAVMPDGRTWMCENLQCSDSFLGVSGGSMWYNNDGATYGRNGLNYGLLYKRMMVRNAIIVVKVPGWHIPTQEEWNALIAACGGGTGAVKKLKSSSGWSGSSSNGTDAYGFRLVPAGYWNYLGSFYNVGKVGEYKSSTGDNAQPYSIRFKQDNSIEWTNSLSNENISIRLIKDV